MTRVSPDPGRFLVLTPALDGRDGVSEVSRQVLRTLIDHAGPDAVESWVYRGSEPAGSQGIPARGFRSAQGQPWRLLSWAVRAAARRQPDLTVVVMHTHLAPVAGILALRGARRVFFLHGIEAWSPLRWRERTAMAGTVRLIANSRRTAALFRAANPGMPPATVCHLGVAPAGTAIRWAAEPGFALIVGRLAAAERYKGHDALLDAWPLVLQAVPQARLVIAGDGDDLDRLRARVEEGQLSRAVRFVGRVSDSELRGLYQACAMFVMPSSGEGFGLVYLEAMREAKPCVALRTAEEIVVDGSTGLLLDNVDSRALADALIRLFAAPALRYRLGAAGAARVRAMFEECHFARRFSDAIGLPAIAGSRAPERKVSAGA